MFIIKKRMYLTITQKHTNVIKDSKGNKLYKFPCNTLLDDILIDLWSEIIKYMYYHQYALGIHNKTHIGYRKMTKDEFDSHKVNFLNYYWMNKGIYSLDDLGSSENKFLTVDGHYIKFNSYVISFSSISKNNKTLIKSKMFTDAKMFNVDDYKVNMQNFYLQDSILVLLVPDI